jgi:cellulose synthase/poly-beta-1,6-N-acetylglucosamine synthase-like glycosyltransferase
VVAVAFVGSMAVLWGLAARRGHRARARVFPNDPPPGGPLPLVSILVPAWNEDAVLANCVHAVGRLEYPNWECLIVAGGTDRTFARALALAAADRRVIALQQKPNGKNAALNQGLAVARGELVAVLDADCVVEPSWLSALVAGMRRGADACLGDYRPEPLTPISRQFVIDKIAAYYVRGATTLHGGAILLRRSALERIGGQFPEDVPVGTDWDLDQRLGRAGLRKAFVPAARHTTPYPATLSQLVHNEIRWRRAHLLAALRFLDGTPGGRLRGLRELAPYLVASATAIGLVGALGLSLWSPRSAWRVLAALGLGHLWILGRRAGQVFEVAAYSRDWRWLRFLWLPAVTMALTLACAGIAIATPGRVSPHFKGSRPEAPRRSAAH